MRKTMKKSTLRMIEVIVLIMILVFVGIVLCRVLNQVKRHALRVVCGNHLKDLGTAVSVYSKDHDGLFPQLPGTGAWSKKLGFAYDLAKPNFRFGGEQNHVERTITASWYLLVREADAKPSTFVCPYSNQRIFGGSNQGDYLTKLWDFGVEPHKYVSYAMHIPYGAYPVLANQSASFAVAADMSPWFVNGDIVQPISNNKKPAKNITLMPPYFSNPSISRDIIMPSNSIPHDREGQFILFADGHGEFCKTPDVGVKHDNIYTFWSGVMNSMGSENKSEPILQQKPSESDIRIGTNPTARDKDNDAKSADDSFLAI